VDREARLTHLITHYFGGGEAFALRFARSIVRLGGEEWRIHIFSY
jgi:hypothetical protein